MLLFVGLKVNSRHIVNTLIMPVKLSDVAIWEAQAVIMHCLQGSMIFQLSLKIPAGMHTLMLQLQKALANYVVLLSLNKMQKIS